MIYAALAVLIALQAIDLWTTSKFRRGHEQEANPVARWVWGRFGFGAVVAVKVGLTAAAVAYVLHYPDEPFAWGVLAIVTLGAGYAAFHNIRAMRRRAR